MNFIFLSICFSFGLKDIACFSLAVGIIALIIGIILSTTKSYYSEDFAEHWQEELRTPMQSHGTIHSRARWIEQHPQYEGLNKSILITNQNELLRRTQQYLREVQRNVSGIELMHCNVLGGHIVMHYNELKYIVMHWVVTL